VKAGAQDLGIDEGTLGDWVNTDKRRPGRRPLVGEDERADLARAGQHSGTRSRAARLTRGP